MLETEAQERQAKALTEALMVAYELHGLHERIRRHQDPFTVQLPNRIWMESAVRTILEHGMVRMP